MSAHVWIFSFPLLWAIVAHWACRSLIWLWIAFQSFATIRWLICFILFIPFRLFGVQLSSFLLGLFAALADSFVVFFVPECWCVIRRINITFGWLVAVWIVVGPGTVKMKTHSTTFSLSGQYNIYMYTTHDEPPHFNLRFTASDYNNTPPQRRIKRNNCCLIFRFLCSRLLLAHTHTHMHTYDLPHTCRVHADIVLFFTLPYCHCRYSVC